jgi:hypothetical protein
MLALSSAADDSQKPDGVRALKEFPTQPFLFGSSAPWIEVKDGNPTAMALFLRHYTARQHRKVFQFVGPG